MKKLFTLLFAALMSASLFASPTTVPTAADLALRYDVAQNVVLCCYFDVAPCNAVVLAGSYNGWSDDPAKCKVFEELEGFEGWYVAQAKYTKGFQAKPLQLNNNSFDGWDYQAGDPEAWIWHAGEQAEVTGGIPGEANVYYGGAGAYIYEIAYWKNHNNPCEIKMHTYKLVLLPPTVEDKDFFTPAVSGAFNEWTSEALGEDIYKGKIAYTKTVVAAEGKNFKFLELEFGWMNQFQWKDSLYGWLYFDETKLPESDKDSAEVVEVVFDYSDTTKYRYALADATFRDVKVNLTAPVGAPKEGIELMGQFVGGQNFGKGVLMEFDGKVYTATVKSVEPAEFNFRQAGTWDNQIQTLNLEGEWENMWNLQFGEWWEEEGGVYVADIDLSDPNEYKWTDPKFVNISLECNRTEGKVTGSGQYTKGSNVTIFASPNEGYHFVQWNDSITDNPREIVLTQDTTFTAIFAPNFYTLNVTCDSTLGSVYAPNGEYEYGTLLQMSAKAKYGYHFAHWSDGNTQNPRVITIKSDVTLEAIFEPNIYTVSAAYNPQGTISGTGKYEYKASCTLEAVPNNGYHFVQWLDGEVVNPRSIIVTQDTILGVIYAKDTTGTCGKDYALTWAYNAGTKTLTISGSGSFDEHMECGIEAKQNMEKLVIDEGVTSIGAYAFSGCSNLTTVQLPASIKTIGDKAFENCLDLISIYNYRERPCLVSTSAFEGVNKFDCTLYVLAGSVAMYKSEGSNWKDFYFIEPIGSTAVSEPVTDVETKPADNNVTITWPVVAGTDTYTVEILKGGVVVCTLIFSADGQLTGIAFAPGRDGGHQAPAATFTENGGMRFTVTGLDSGTNYQLKVTAKDASNKEMATYSSEFKTTSNEEIATGIESQELKTNSQKLLINGQVLILRGDKTYTITGQEVR